MKRRNFLQILGGIAGCMTAVVSDLAQPFHSEDTLTAKDVSLIKARMHKKAIPFEEAYTHYGLYLEKMIRETNELSISHLFDDIPKVTGGQTIKVPLVKR